MISLEWTEFNWFLSQYTKRNQLSAIKSAASTTICGMIGYFPGTDLNACITQLASRILTGKQKLDETTPCKMATSLSHHRN